MSYAVDLTPEAVGDLARLPLPVANYVEARLRDLARDPVSLSRPSHFPYPVDGQAFKFTHDFEDARYHFHVLFRYGQDEQVLHVLFIAMMREGPE